MARLVSTTANEHQTLCCVLLSTSRNECFFAANIFYSLHPAWLLGNFLCNRNDISEAIQHWPRSERRLILWEFLSVFFLFYFIWHRSNEIFSEIDFYICIAVVCGLSFNECIWLLVSNRRSGFYWILRERERKNKVQLKRSNGKNNV